MWSASWRSGRSSPKPDTLDEILPNLVANLNLASELIAESSFTAAELWALWSKINDEWGDNCSKVVRPFRDRVTRTDIETNTILNVSKLAEIKESDAGYRILKELSPP
jgi:hypothetical protein